MFLSVYLAGVERLALSFAVLETAVLLVKLNPQVKGPAWSASSRGVRGSFLILHLSAGALRFYKINHWR